MADVVEMHVRATPIEGLVAITMKQVTDERGTVREFYRESAFVDAGLPSLGPWVQVNVTASHRGAIRGMHGENMSKLVAVASGEAHGAYVDTRPGSSTRGQVWTTTLRPGDQVLVPPGVANGFQATAEGETQYLYCFDHEWVPGMAGVSCSPVDPALGIDWPVPVDVTDRAQISQKDLDAPTLADALGEGS
jgi:dTDP-4-dehydrorhamnose 3,5-epimerase